MAAFLTEIYTHAGQSNAPFTNNSAAKRAGGRRGGLHEFINDHAPVRFKQRQHRREKQWRWQRGRKQPNMQILADNSTKVALHRNTAHSSVRLGSGQLRFVALPAFSPTSPATSSSYDNRRGSARPFRSSWRATPGYVAFIAEWLD